MLRTLNTLFLGASARSEEALKDHFAIELIDQKIREAEKQLKVAKTQLALLIQRERGEGRLKDQLESRIEDLTTRAKKALEGDREDRQEAPQGQGEWRDGDWRPRDCEGCQIHQTQRRPRQHQTQHQTRCHHQ